MLELNRINIHRKLRSIRFQVKRSHRMLLSVRQRIEKKILFLSFEGRQYSDNPRSISEKMHELYPDYTLVWGIAKGASPQNIPDYVKTVPTDSREFDRELLTSFCFVQNEAMRSDLYKRKGQLYIQTWHGDRGIKKIHYDSMKAKGLRSSTVADGKVTDLFMVGSEYAKKRIRTAFRYNGPCLESGCARNDKLLNPEHADEVRARLGLKPGCRILLYAPTLRSKGNAVESDIDLDEVLQILKEKGEDWVCLVRSHPKSGGIINESASHLINVSAYPDMADLLMIADMLITDYSSCAGDFILRRKPVILAQFDLEAYQKEFRSFHTDINQIGFPIVHNRQELNDLLRSTSDEEFAAICDRIMAFYGVTETGHASEDVCRYIDAAYRSFAGQP